MLVVETKKKNTHGFVPADMRRELTFRLIGKFSVPGRAIFLLTRRRVFHFARLRNQVKNSSSTLVDAYVRLFRFYLPGR